MLVDKFCIQPKLRLIDFGMSKPIDQTIRSLHCVEEYRPPELNLTPSITQ